MFKFGKKKGDAPADDANLPAVSDASGEAAEGEAAGSKKKKLPLLFIIAPVALLVLGGGGAAAFFMLQPKKAEAHGAEGEKGAGEHGKPEKKEEKKGGHGGGEGGEGGAADPSQGVIAAGPDGVTFFTLPDMTMNIQSSDGRATYLKLKLTLETHDAEVATHLQEEMPRLQDMFTTFMRELRPEDLSGSAGAYQLRAEILRRVNLIAAPGKVDAVLIEEMLVGNQ
ncbi:flagellar basal body-associated FliL family protein [Brevundimonas sp. SORGH_AS_0993]|uniref:flagellar basal body-associated FliL family protein n=1 Tax=Brevundimonas sp. SORGH_AS_0993 TaxID=3041794 RepID=UPI0027890842|nr:flagellar basal body-associated FliL family protein [Brevundimonas sp. SORGH_AS_0993]MDQ1154067.1 flagellar FliL protein [Brevundimonas sp. SORGH_AS_0993]